MNTLDRYGLRITTSSPSAVDSYNAGLDHLLARSGKAAEFFNEALRIDPTFAMAHFLLGRQLLADGDVAAGQRALRRAVGLSGRVSRREQQHMFITMSLYVNRDSDAFAAATSHLDEYPRDIVLLDIYSWLRFFVTPGRKTEGVQFYQAFRKFYGDDWALDQMHSFSLAEVGAYDEAVAGAERVLACRGPTAGAALHTLAHVYDARGRSRDGDRLLADVLPGLSGWICEHLSLHRAIFRLDMGDTAWVRDAFQQLTKKGTSTLDGVELLYRYLLYGGERILPTSALAEIARNAISRPASIPSWRRRVADRVRALSYRLGRSAPTARYAMYLVAVVTALEPRRLPAGITVLFSLIASTADGDRETADKCLAILRERAERDGAREDRLMLSTGEAVAAFMREDYGATIDRLEPFALSDFEYLAGGTRDHHELIGATLVEAQLRAGRFEQALAVLDRQSNPDARARSLLARARGEAGRGNARTAAGIAADLEKLWQDADAGGPQRVALASVQQPV